MITRLSAILYLLLFCDRVNGASTDMKLELNTKNRTTRRDNIEFNPDAILNTPQMIRRTGYRAETHVITTEDGYLLTLHRIPGSNDSLPVLLQHGLLGSSHNWITLGKDKALAYLLADQGFDVWLGNYRGNTYSRKHISLSASDTKFWDFSFHEMGIYDLPAMITFITNMRSQPLYTYIGHSMGTTGFYIMSSERPEIAQKVRLMISFAPVALMSHTRNPVRFIIPIWKKLKLYKGEFLQSDLVRSICKQNLAMQELCVHVLFGLIGSNYEQFNYTLLPVIWNHIPAGTSAKTVTHYAQQTESQKFRQFDYGSKKNLLIYNSLEPPYYNLKNINVPIALIYGENDWFINTEDVKRLRDLLPNVIDMYKVPLPNFTHLDFIFAMDAPKLVYEQVFKIMKKENLTNVTS